MDFVTSRNNLSNWATFSFSILLLARFTRKEKRGKEEGITETHNEFLTTVTAVWYCIQPLVSTCFFACTSLAPMMIVLPPPPPVFHSPLTKHSLAKPYLAREGRREGGRLGMTNLTP